MSVNEIPEALRTALPDAYDLQRIVGRGGMATVYKASDVRHDRPVAVKVLHPELAASIAGERFLNEIGFSAQLTHPHILMLIDSGSADDFLYYVMPFVDDSLRAVLEREKTLAPEKALELARDVADALSYAHRRGIVHRDIKPENILIADGQAVVADFGVAKAISQAGGEKITRTGYPVGTLGYMSPEQAAGRSDLTERTDIYSLACVAFEMVIGEPPGMWVTEEAGRLGRFVDAPRQQRDKLDRLPGSLESALVGAMRLRPEERYESAIAFADALQAGLSGKKVYKETDAQRIVRRAAELEVAPAAGDSAESEEALSLGGVERMAAEVGIPPEFVRDAARREEAADRPPAKRSKKTESESGIEMGGLLGATGRIELERTIEVEATREAYALVLEELRDTIGEAGHLNETLSQSLSWEHRRGLFKKSPRLKVHVSQRRGKTRIKVTRLPGLGRRVFALGALASSAFVTMGFMGVGADSDAFVVFSLMGIAAGVGVFTGFRKWFKARMRRKSRATATLLQRLVEIVRDFGPPALPGRQPTTSDPGQRAER